MSLPHDGKHPKPMETPLEQEELRRQHADEEWDECEQRRHEAEIMRRVKEQWRGPHY